WCCRASGRRRRRCPCERRVRHKGDAGCPWEPPENSRTGGQRGKQGGCCACSPEGGNKFGFEKLPRPNCLTGCEAPSINRPRPGERVPGIIGTDPRLSPFSCVRVSRGYMTTVWYKDNGALDRVTSPRWFRILIVLVMNSP